MLHETFMVRLKVAKHHAVVEKNDKERNNAITMARAQLEQLNDELFGETLVGPADECCEHGYPAFGEGSPQCTEKANAGQSEAEGYTK